MSETTPTQRPSPTPVGAVLSTLLAWATATVFWGALVPGFGYWVALAVGMVLGYGGIGTLAARMVPAPAELRIGLRGFARRAWVPLLLLLPAVLLASEIDNWVRPLIPPATAPEDGSTGAPEVPEEVLPFLALEFVITTVLLRPVLEEFFFRGVIQQGVIATLGPGAGIGLTTLCFVIATAGFAIPMGPDRIASAAVQAAFLGPLLSLLRHRTGSVLAPIVVQMGGAALGGAAVAAHESIPIPGFNAPGDHTPAAWLLPAAVGVALAVALLLRAPEPPEIPLPPADEAED